MCASKRIIEMNSHILRDQLLYLMICVIHTEFEADVAEQQRAVNRVVAQHIRPAIFVICAQKSAIKTI